MAEETRLRAYWEMLKAHLGRVKAEGSSPEEIRRFQDEHLIIGSKVTLSPEELSGKRSILAFFSKIIIDPSPDDKNSY